MRRFRKPVTRLSRQMLVPFFCLMVAAGPVASADDLAASAGPVIQRLELVESDGPGPRPFGETPDLARHLDDALSGAKEVQRVAVDLLYHRVTDSQ